MQRLYTIQEVKDYAAEVRATEQQFRDATRRGDLPIMVTAKDQLYIMHRILTQMQASLEKHGAYQPGPIRRKIHKVISKLPKLEILGKHKIRER